jgi:hypothetical protein
LRNYTREEGEGGEGRGGVKDEVRNVLRFEEQITIVLHYRFVLWYCIRSNFKAP